MLRIASLCRLSLLFGLVLMGAARPLCAQQAPPVSSSALPDTLEGVRSWNIPLVYDPLFSPFAYVYISINEQEPLPFLLDTGANVGLVFTPQAARTLHLLPTGETVLTLSKRKISVVRVGIRFPLIPDAYKTRMMPIGNGKQNGCYVSSLIPRGALPDGKPIAGIAGVALWQTSTIRLDFAAKKLNVYTDTLRPLHLPDAVTFPLKEKDGGYYVTLPIDGKQTVDFRVDTGCDVTHTSAAVARALHARVTRMDVENLFVGGTQQGDFGLLPSLPLGTLLPQNVGVTFSQNEKIGATPSVGHGETLLGMNVLSRYRVVFDFPNKQFHLQPGANYDDAARVEGFPVVRVGRKGTQLQVKDVELGSAAYRAGVRKGDVVLSIDDRPVEGFTDAALQRLIDGFGGTQARLQVQRGGETKTITYARYGVSVDCASVEMGIDVHVSAEGRLFVDDAYKGFPAYKAGIRKSDEILAIDGKPVQQTDYEAVLDVLNNSKTNPLSVTILRKGETEPRQVQIGRLIARNAEVDNAVLEVALEYEFGAEKGKRVVSRKNFPTFVAHDPHLVMGDLDRIKQEYDKAGRDVIDYPFAYEEALQRAFPGCTSCASASQPRYRLDGTALITLHWEAGHPISAVFEMQKQGDRWKVMKYSSSVML